MAPREVPRGVQSASGSLLPMRASPLSRRSFFAMLAGAACALLVRRRPPAAELSLPVVPDWSGLQTRYDDSHEGAEALARSLVASGWCAPIDNPFFRL